MQSIRRWQDTLWCNRVLLRSGIGFAQDCMRVQLRIDYERPVSGRARSLKKEQQTGRAAWFTVTAPGDEQFLWSLEAEAAKDQQWIWNINREEKRNDFT